MPEAAAAAAPKAKAVAAAPKAKAAAAVGKAKAAAAVAKAKAAAAVAKPKRLAAVAKAKAAAAPEDGAKWVTGCSKCRYKEHGCGTCRPWAESGHRGYEVGPEGEIRRPAE